MRRRPQGSSPPQRCNGQPKHLQPPPQRLSVRLPWGWPHPPAPLIPGPAPAAVPRASLGTPLYEAFAVVGWVVLVVVLCAKTGIALSAEFAAVRRVASAVVLCARVDPAFCVASAVALRVTVGAALCPALARTDVSHDRHDSPRQALKGALKSRDLLEGYVPREPRLSGSDEIRGSIDQSVVSPLEAEGSQGRPGYDAQHQASGHRGQLPLVREARNSQRP